MENKYIFAYNSVLSKVDDKIIEDQTNQLEKRDHNYYYKQTRDGKTIKDVKISKKEFDRYIQNLGKNINIDKDQFVQAKEIISKLINDIEKIKNEQSIEYSSKLGEQSLKTNEEDNQSIDESINKINSVKKLPERVTPGFSGSKDKIKKWKSTKLTKKQNKICKSIMREYGLNPDNATKEEVETLYRKLANEYNPEKCNQSKSCLDKYYRINRNYSRYMSKCN